MARAEAASSLLNWPRISGRAIAALVSVNLLLLLYQSHAEQIIYAVIFPVTISQLCLLAAGHVWGDFRPAALLKTAGGLLAWVGFYHLVVPQDSGVGFTSIGEALAFFGMLTVCVLLWRMVLAIVAPRLLRERFTIRSGLECTAWAGLAFAICRWALGGVEDMAGFFAYVAVIWMPLACFFLLTQAALARRAWRSLAGIALLALGFGVALEFIMEGEIDGLESALYLLVIAYTVAWWFLVGGIALTTELGDAVKADDRRGGELQAGAAG